MKIRSLFRAIDLCMFGGFGAGLASLLIRSTVLDAVTLPAFAVSSTAAVIGWAVANAGRDENLETT